MPARWFGIGAARGVRIGEHWVARLMCLLGLQAPRTSDPHSEHRGVALSAQELADRAAEPRLVCWHHLHPVRCGFRYLMAIMDWALAAVEHVGRALLHGRAGIHLPEDNLSEQMRNIITDRCSLAHSALEIP